ncbi:MAG: helix-turn-helix domain-containing protein, partial [Acidimicrobiales bacterium]
MSGQQHPFLRALRPVAQAIGATIVPVRSMAPGDIPLEWEGELVGGFRVGDLHGALDRLVRSVERAHGGSLGELPREQKQAAIRMLDERGAFLLRRAADDIAEIMGVSRITIYNYLNAIADR